MNNIGKSRFSASIDAPVPRVWDTMLAAETYERWAAAFTESSTYEGSWSKGSRLSGP
ncbi:MAG: hypothetical protein HKN77_01095 [Woeseiaceae bacterium]|nr:hypothetical protein [Woeseiaceae bacterium]